MSDLRGKAVLNSFVTEQAGRMRAPEGCALQARDLGVNRAIHRRVRCSLTVTYGCHVS
jgi:hypothetical protein